MSTEQLKRLVKLGLSEQITAAKSEELKQKNTVSKPMLTCCRRDVSDVFGVQRKGLQLSTKGVNLTSAKICARQTHEDFNLKTFCFKVKPKNIKPTKLALNTAFEMHIAFAEGNCTEQIRPNLQQMITNRAHKKPLLVYQW